jgi:hypothetical protein
MLSPNTERYLRSSGANQKGQHTKLVAVQFGYLEFALIRRERCPGQPLPRILA